LDEGAEVEDLECNTNEFVDYQDEDFPTQAIDNSHDY